MHRLIIVGSPREDGKSAHLAEEIFNSCIEDCPHDSVAIVSVTSVDVDPCVGCGSCKDECAEKDLPESLEEGDTLAPCELIAGSDAKYHQCAIDDEMPEVRVHLDAADELIMVSPVYFSSAPAQLAALLDRFQPYYYSNVRALVQSGRQARCAVLHIVGDGGDPHGYEPLIGLVRSALAVAGFRLDRAFDWVGKINERGEITDHAKEIDLSLYSTSRDADPATSDAKKG